MPKRYRKKTSFHRRRRTFRCRRRLIRRKFRSIRKLRFFRNNVMKVSETKSMHGTIELNLWSSGGVLTKVPIAGLNFYHIT